MVFINAGRDIHPDFSEKKVARRHRLSETAKVPVRKPTVKETRNLVYSTKIVIFSDITGGL